MLFRETNSDIRPKGRCSQLVFRMGESRTELIAWLNDLLSLNYTKVEQCGTGGAYCQIMDSIYGELKRRTGVFAADVYTVDFRRRANVAS